MSTVTPITILGAIRHHDLFGRWFGSARTWTAWFAFLKALFGLSMSSEEADIFRQHTGRAMPPTSQAREAWMVIGRRGGKSRVAGLVAVFLACFKDYAAILAPGEKGTVMLLAADRRQARVLMRYVTGLLDGVPALASMIVSSTAESVVLSNRIVIEIHTASFRAIRGYTVVAAICDEIAFWRSDDSANPDVEILNGLRPGMATVPGALLLCISSPYARRGALWQAHKDHFGHEDDPVLVWQADTRTMNPSVSEAVIESAYEADETAARSEYGALFRSDLEDYVSHEVVSAVVVKDRRGLPVMPTKRYVAFVDPSGGSGDSMTLAIAHVERDKAILDVIREVRPPFSPEEVVEAFCAVMKEYGITKVEGDRYAGEWPRERFRKHGRAYIVAERPKSEFYRDLLPLLTGGRVELLDDRRLTSQLLALERRTSWGGRDSIDHATGSHDDVANAAAGALVTVWRTRRGDELRPYLGGIRVTIREVAEAPHEFRDVIQRSGV